MEQGRDGEIRDLKAEISRLLAAALTAERAHEDAAAEQQRVHDAEIAEARTQHDEEMTLLAGLRDEDAQNFERALASRDVIGQAKGIIMASLGCSPDDAFQLLRTQSQAENRKLVEVATEIVERTARRRPTQ